jgi:hypothetical protein
MEEIKEFVKSLYTPPTPPKASGFTTIVMVESKPEYFPYLEDRDGAINKGVRQAKTYHYTDKLKGVKVYIYDRSAETLEEIDFTKF